MKINKNLTNVNYNLGNNRNIRYIVIHYTGNNGDTAYDNTVYFKNVNRWASAHYFVDNNEVWQCVEDKNIAWHCGTDGVYYSKCRNDTSIGVEMCSRRYNDGSFYFDSKTIDNCVELVKSLMQQYGVKIENVIRHYDVTHKVCPEPYVRNVSEYQKFKKRLMEDDMTVEKVQAIITETMESKFNLFFEKAMKNFIEKTKNKECGNYAMDSWKKAIGSKLLDGSAPQSPLTRQDFSVIANKLGLSKYGQELPDWGKTNLSRAIEKGVTDGSNPMDVTTRLETAIMCLNTIDAVMQEVFNGSDDHVEKE